MDYAALAAEMLQKTGALMKTNVPKQMSVHMHGEMFILHYILHKNDKVLPSELSVAMDASTARVAAALKSMESKGLIERRTDITDRRKVIVSITEFGRNFVKGQHQDMVKKVARILTELGEDDAREYIRIVTKMTEISKKMSVTSECHCSENNRS